MIYIDTNKYSGYYDPEVAPSRYEANIEGALMHVYENTCNYNRLVEAATLAEMRHYHATGVDDYFLNEASLGGFIESAKKFFMKVIEKIKALIHKAIMALQSFTMKNKDFVRKYGKEIRRKQKPKNLSLKCHLENLMDIDDREFTTLCTNLENTYKDTSSQQAFDADGVEGRATAVSADNYNKQDKIEQNYGETLHAATSGGISKGSYTLSEAIEELKEHVIGDEGTVDEDWADKHILDVLRYIESCDDDIKTLKKSEKTAVKTINKYIKDLESFAKDNGKQYTKDMQNEDRTKRNNYNTYLNFIISNAQANSNLINGALGVYTQAHQMRAKEGKALCLKWVMGKVEESASYYSESSYYGDDIFAGIKMI